MLYLGRLVVSGHSNRMQTGCGLQSTVLAFPPGPPPLDDKLPGWEDRACVSNLDIRRNIFCNRSLNMTSIKVGHSRRQYLHCLSIASHTVWHYFGFLVMLMKAVSASLPSCTAASAFHSICQLLCILSAVTKPIRRQEKTFSFKLASYMHTIHKLQRLGYLC